LTSNFFASSGGVNICQVIDKPRLWFQTPVNDTYSQGFNFG
jgi:hypothetical protein